MIFPSPTRARSIRLTGRTQGLLDRCSATDTCPRIFHVATALEMWEGRQSLGLTDPLGQRDVDDPPNVRTFIMASTQHGAAPLPLATRAPFGNCQQQPNPESAALDDARAADRADRLGARRRDAAAKARRRASPTARWSRPTKCAFRKFPANAYGGVERPATSPLRIYDTLHVLDFGPLYRAADSSGIILREPPLRPLRELRRAGAAGRRRRQRSRRASDRCSLQVPIGTYTGWNLGRKDRFENGLCNLQGSFIPFAATRAERLAAGDPRPSIEERYPSREVYVAAFGKAAADLVAQALSAAGGREAAGWARRERRRPNAGREQGVSSGKSPAAQRVCAAPCRTVLMNCRADN